MSDFTETQIKILKEQQILAEKVESFRNVIKLENKKIEAYPRNFYLDHNVLNNENFKKEICKRSKLNHIYKDIDKGRKTGYSCKNIGKEFDCKNCQGFFNEELDKSNKQRGSATQTCFAAALDKIQQTISNHFRPDHPINFDTIAKIALFSGDSILNLIRLSGPYLFTKDGKIVNVNKKYGIIPKTKTSIVNGKEVKETVYFSDLLRIAKDNLIKVKGPDCNISPSALLSQLKSYEDDFCLEEGVIKEILETYII